MSVEEAALKGSRQSRLGNALRRREESMDGCGRNNSVLEPRKSPGSEKRTLLSLVGKKCLLEDAALALV